MTRRLWPLLFLVLAGCASSGGPGSGKEERVYLHNVAAGESLADIAAEYYGDASRSRSLANFNELEDERVRTGMVLRIPMSPKDVSRMRVREQAREPYNKGIELAENGSYLDAVTQFGNALAIDPDFVDAHYNLGVTLQKLNSYDKAIDEFHEAVRLRPDSALYRYALGNGYFHVGKYAEAASAFEDAIARDPHHTKALYSLAVTWEKLDQRERAIAAWEHYLEVDGTSVWATEARKRLKNLK